MFNNATATGRNATPAELPQTPHQARPPETSPANPGTTLPIMRQSMDVSNTEHPGGTRSQQSSAADGKAPTPLPSTIPELKSQRSEMRAPPATATFSREHHGALITLIQQHGGEVVTSTGNTITLTLPAADNLDFQVPYYCQRVTMLSMTPPIPDVESFSAAVYDTFVDYLEAAALNNRASLVRQLLAIGLAENAGDLLRKLAQQAHAAGATDVVDAITDTCAYWVQGPDPAALNRRGELSFRIGESDLPPPDWQAGLGPCLSKAESGKLEIALREGDTTAVINLLFKPEKHPTSGQFYVRPCQGDLLELVRTHGAPSFTGYPLLVLYSSDFNRAGLQNQLLQRQATDQRASLRPERSSLAMAAQWGDIELFQTLWSHANDDQRDTYAEAALHQFAANGMTGMVHQLLPHAKYASSNPGILCAAAAGGHTATCAALLKAGADLHTASRALASAAASGHTATCAFLISIGAHVDGVARFNHPLLEAVTGGHLKTCKLLIAAGARLDRDKSDKQSSILARAVANGDVSLYQFLLDQGAATVAPVPHAELLAIAARANQVHMLNYLLKPDDDLELADANGDTLLLSACKADATEAVAYLLERGSRVIPKGSTNDSAIVYALNRRHLPLVELFLRADVPAEYWANNLGLAAQCASPEVISAIMDLLGDQFSTWLTPENNPLLSIPYSSYGNKRSEVQEHHQRLSRLLSNARLPLNHISSEGDDALTLAVAAHDIIAVDMLVKAGFGISHRSQYQKNAIGVALQNFVRKNDAAWIVDNDRGAAASSILRTLSRILLQKDDRFSLAYEVYDRQYLPVPRDLAMFLMFADSESTVDLASMMIRDRDLTGDICRSLMAVPDTASIAAISTLGDLDIPSAMNIRLRSLLRQLAPLRDILFKHGSNINNDRAFLAAVDGIYLILASQRDEAHAAADIAAYYASAPIDDEWKAALTRMASQWLTRRIAEASEREGNRIGQVFGELFDRCAADSVDGDDYVAALKQSAPEPGKVAAALHEAGIYAALADEIDVAWSQAWQRVKLSPAALLDLRSNDQLADELLAAFRQALNDRVDKPSAEGHLINRINEPAEAAALYTDLMFQQLHMLKQFSSPEPH